MDEELPGPCEGLGFAEITPFTKAEFEYLVVRAFSRPRGLRQASIHVVHTPRGSTWFWEQFGWIVDPPDLHSYLDRLDPCVAVHIALLLSTLGHAQLATPGCE